MDFLTEWVAGGSLFTIAAAILVRMRRTWVAAKEGAELVVAVNALAAYVQQENDWSPEEGRRAGELAAVVKTEAEQFVRAARAIL